MKRTLRMLALLIALFLLPLNVPGEEDLAGRWTGRPEEDVVTLLFAQDGSFILLFDETGEVSVNIGTWSPQPGIIRLQMQDGSVISLDYRMEGGNLIAREGEDEPWVTFALEPWQPPEGVAGEWQGQDTNGTFVLQLKPDNSYTFDYTSGAAIGSGDYAEYQGVLYLILSGESYLPLGFALSGDGMTITNQFTGDSYPLTRRQPVQQSAGLPVPTVQPVPVTTQAMPQPQPEETPQMEPEQTEGPAVTRAPAAAAGLAGSWEGVNQSGKHIVKFSADGGISFIYAVPENAALNRKGTFTATADAINAAWEGGTMETIRYILMGDSLLLSDADLQNPVTYSRAAAEDIGFDSSLIGTWGGYDAAGYFEFTFTGAGAYTKLVLPDESRTHSGSASTREGVLIFQNEGVTEQFSYAFKEGWLVIDDVIEAVKLPGPLSREPLPQSEQASTVDPAMAGVWGGMEGGVYAEVAFLADGRYERFAPSDEPYTDNGNFMSGNGNLAILTLQGSSQGTYAVEGDILTLTFTGREPVQLIRKEGLLRRTAPAEP